MNIKLNLPKNITFTNSQLICQWTCPQCKCHFSQLDLEQHNYQFLITEQINWLSLDGMITFSLKAIIHPICPPPMNQCDWQATQSFYQKQFNPNK